MVLDENFSRVDGRRMDGRENGNKNIILKVIGAVVRNLKTIEVFGICNVEVNG